MITANCIKAPDNYFLVRLNYPANNRKEYTTVKGMENVNRIIYFHNRRYIVEKLSSWLRQRMYVADITNNTGLLASAAQLYTVVQFHQNASLIGVCGIIFKNAERFKAIAPGEQSKHFKHFNSIILPILNFCDEFLHEEVKS